MIAELGYHINDYPKSRILVLQDSSACFILRLTLARMLIYFLISMGMVKEAA